MELIDGALLMRHEHLARASVELEQIAATTPCPDGILHHPPKTFDGVEVMPTMRGQEMAPKLVVVVRQCRVEFVRPVDPAAVDDHDDLFTGFAEDCHHLMEILAQLLGIEVRHNFVEDAGGAILHGAHDREQDAAGEATPGTIPYPLLPFEALLPFDLAVAQRSDGEAGALGASPPACPEHGKAPQDRFVFLEENDLSTACLVCEGGEGERAVSEVRWGGIKAPGRAAVG
jgi:hypothetical protein